MSPPTLRRFARPVKATVRLPLRRFAIVVVPLSGALLATSACGFGGAPRVGPSDRAHRAAAVPSADGQGPSSPASADGAPGSLTHQILQSSAALRREGIDLVQWGPDPRTGKELIVVYRLTPRAARELVGRYGANAIELRNSMVPSIPSGQLHIKPTMPMSDGQRASKPGCPAGSTEAFGPLLVAGRAMVRGCGPEGAADLS